MRVLYLLPTLAPSGIGRVVIEHLRRLPRDRFAAELAVLRADGALRAELPEDVPVHLLPAERFPRSLARRRSLRALVDARGIDLVSSHGGYLNCVNLAEGLGRGGRVARVTTIHADGRGNDRPHFRSRAGRLIQRLLAREASRVVFLCRETAEAMAGAYGARGEQVAVVPNGVDASELRALAAREPPPRWPPGALRLLAAGRLVPQKGFDLLLRALAAARGRGLDASLLILGEGPARPELERLRADLSLDGAVGMPGRAPNPFPAFAHADIFVLSSRYEGFPLVLLEALGLGRPIVAAACPAGPAEILGDGSGVLVPPRDPGALAAALLDLARDPARRAELSRRAEARADAFRWSGVVDRLAALFEATRCASGRARPAARP